MVLFLYKNKNTTTKTIMDYKNENIFDVLSSLETFEDQEPKTKNIMKERIQSSTPEIRTKEEITIQDDSHLFFEEKVLEDSEQKIVTEEKPEITPVQTKKEEKKRTFIQHIRGNIVFLIKYLSTSTVIFVLLLFTTNYSAYYNIAISYIFQKDFESKSESLLNSVEASSLEEIKQENSKEEIFSLESAPIHKEEKFNSIETLASKAKRAEVDLGITITPYENRIVIPKIGKNIPLIEITQPQVSWIDELNDIFMKELENGVIRYPGSAKPGEKGNSFIFGHSSNFPWIKWDYNDVFALLDKVVYDDEVIVYYNQKKYIYKIRTKEVIHPGDTSILKRDHNKSEITLMTCWPIGTTLNRLILIWELVEIK